ncbi:MAG: glycosyltransferase [Bdellovibrionales bacterium]
MNTYPVAFACPGGGEIQFSKTHDALSAMGHSPLLYDQWHPQFDVCDIVHYFSLQGGSSSFCYYSKFSVQKPLVISPILWVGGDTSKYAMNEAIDLLNICDLALPNSDIEGDKLSQVCGVPREKFHTVYNGIDPIFFNSKESKSLFRDHFKQDRPFLLCVANIEYRKNQQNLIRAFELLNLDMDLILLGNIRDKAYFKESVQGKKNTKYFGYLDHHSPLLRSAYAGCEAFVLPSQLETPGLAALEAAATGAKVLITEEGSASEYFEDMATYANPTDVDSIAHAIVSVLSKDHCDDLKNHVCEKFTWENAAMQTLNAYKDVLEASTT